jgi:hypothetical protein
VDLLAAHEDYSALYSIDDTESDGLSCDECGGFIFEPDVEAQLIAAIEDIMSDPARPYSRASRILSLFQDNGFELPERFES